MRLLLASVLLAACAEEMMPVIEPLEPLEIVSFAAESDRVTACDSAELSWQVTGADLVSIVSENRTLVASFLQQGTVESTPICEDETFKLTAKRGGESISKTASVAAEWGEPEIRVFLAAEQVPGSRTISLVWETHEARKVRLEQEGIEVSRMDVPIEDLIAGRTSRGTFTTVAESATISFTLTAENPSGSVSSTLEVELPNFTFTTFLLRPPAGVGTTNVIVFWSVIGWVRELRIDDVPVGDFPGGVGGSFLITVEPGQRITMVERLGTSTTAVFGSPVPEVEPNSSIEEANRVRTKAIRGRLDRGDVDVYSFTIPPPHANSSIWLSDLDGRSCVPFDVVMSLYDVNLALVGEGADSCSGLSTNLFLSGDHYLVIQSPTIEEGEYLLYVDL